MEYIQHFVIASLISWVSLLIIIPIARKVADFSMPPWPETLWKLAVIAAAGNGVAVVLDPLNTFLSWAVGIFVFFGLLYKLFDVDFFGALVIVVVSWLVRVFLLAALIGVISSAGI